MKCSSLFGCIGILYFITFILSIYQVAFPEVCEASEPIWRCAQPVLDSTSQVTLELRYGSKVFFNRTGTLTELEFADTIDVPISPGVRNNGTARIEVRLQGNNFLVKHRTDMTLFKVPLQPPDTMLLDRQKNETEGDRYIRYAFLSGTKITHWRRRIAINLLDEYRSFPFRNMPMLVPLKLRGREYLPYLDVDEAFLGPSDWGVLSTNSSKEFPKTRIEVEVRGIATLSIVNGLRTGFREMENLGLSEEDLSQIKFLFSRNRMGRVVAEYIFGLLHVVLLSLAFKNDIGFWKNTRKTTGLSVSVVLSRFIMQLILYLYLADFPSISRIVLWTNGISLLVEFWKVSKVTKTHLAWNGWIPTLRTTKNAAEEETDRYDRECFRALSYALFPLLLAYAVYDLIHEPQASWWSWFIGNAASGVFLAGFIFMTPQLYINYKLKSVAHLPWRAMSYKVFTTFVDDIFAFFFADVPLAYRVATFRDDIVFFFFLYQRYIYRTDYTRANEFGRSYDEKASPSQGETTSNGGRADVRANEEPFLPGEIPQSARKRSPEKTEITPESPEQGENDEFTKKTN